MSTFDKWHVLPVVKLISGCCLLVVLCAGIGLTANAIRSDGVSSLRKTTCKQLLSKEHLQRYEIIYYQSKTLSALDLNKYQFLDVRSESSYSAEHIRGSFPVAVLPDTNNSDTAPVYYDSDSCRNKVKKAAMNALTTANGRPVYVLSDGLKGWKDNGLALEHDKN